VEDKKIIYLSPSTQEKNKGIGNYGTEEYRMNILTDALEKMLEMSGKYIVYRNNELMNMDEIIAQSNRVMPDIHIAIHSNAANTKASGPEVYISRPGGRSEDLANDIYSELLKVYYNPSLGRGIKVDNELKEIREVEAPSVLVEVGFHDNANDANWIMNNNWKIAKSLYNGIDKYFQK
jgi:N-acetylmuramoyl-L-alanine amidase